MNNKIVNISLFIAFLTTLSGCAHSSKVGTGVQTESLSEREQDQQVVDKTIVKPGFTLQISHSADANIKGKYEVGFEGMLQLPYKVRVLVAGKSTAEITRILKERYSAFFQDNNNVTVEIVSRNILIEVRGLVKKPGRYGVREDASLEEIISITGGFAQQGSDKESLGQKPQYLRVVKAGTTSWVDLQNYLLNYETQSELVWNGGETLYFQISADPKAEINQKSSTVTILGEVIQAGEQPIIANADLYTYIAKAGGTRSGADLESVWVFNRTTDTRTKVNLKKHIKFTGIQSGDIIIVDALDNTPGAFEKGLQYTVSITSIISSILILLILL